LEAGILARRENYIIVIIQYALLTSGNESRDCYHLVFHRVSCNARAVENISNGYNYNSAIDMKKKIVISNISPILTNISLKQDEEEQPRVTGTATPAEDREEEEEKEKKKEKERTTAK
jgi:hypothetical protein